MCWAQLIGMGAQAGGSALQGEQNAATLNANATLLDMKASDAETRGGIAEDQHRAKVRQFQGAQRNAMVGLDMNSGTMARVQEDTAAMGELDAQTIRSNAMREAWGYRTEAENMRAQAEGQMGMMDLLRPGGAKFHEKGTRFLLGDVSALKGYRESFDPNRQAFKGFNPNKGQPKFGY